MSKRFPNPENSCYSWVGYIDNNIKYALDNNLPIDADTAYIIKHREEVEVLGGVIDDIELALIRYPNQETTEIQYGLAFMSADECHFIEVLGLTLEDMRAYAERDPYSELLTPYLTDKALGY